jgi:hypothetical protein
MAPFDINILNKIKKFEHLFKFYEKITDQLVYIIYIYSSLTRSKFISLSFNTFIKTVKII